MKKNTFRKVMSGISALVMCLSLFAVSSVCVFADEEETDGTTGSTAQYASTDYANKADQFEAVMSQNADKDVVTFPLPEGYVEGITTRMKYILDGNLIKEKYSAKSFVLPFCGADLTIDGSYLAEVGGDRIEIQLQQCDPIAVQYSCPKCASTPKNDAGDTYTPYKGTLDSYKPVDASTSTYVCPRCKSDFKLSDCGEPEHNETLTGAIQIIETEKHPVVGAYVLELKMWSDNRAVSNFGTADSGITCTLKPSKESLDAAKAEDKFHSFNVYAYLSQTADYSNMEAVIDEEAGTATFRIQDRGWFYIAADKKGDAYLTPGQLLKQLLPFIIIAVVAVIAVVVVLVVLLKKKKAA